MRGIDRELGGGGGGGGRLSIPSWCPASPPPRRKNAGPVRAALSFAATVARQPRSHDAPPVDDESRLRRMNTRTFRWNAPDETTGYHAAEIVGDEVLWTRWSHIHGEGRQDLGAQRHDVILRDGPPVPVPAIVLAQILDALRNVPGR